MPKDHGERITLTIHAAAREMGVSADTIWRWAEAGHLPVFVPPGIDLSSTKAGPRGYQIFKADWESFKRRQTFVGGQPMHPPEPAAKFKSDDPNYGILPKRQKHR